MNSSRRYLNIKAVIFAAVTFSIVNLSALSGQLDGKLLSTNQSNAGFGVSVSPKPNLNADEDNPKEQHGEQVEEVQEEKRGEPTEEDVNEEESQTQPPSHFPSSFPSQSPSHLPSHLPSLPTSSSASYQKPLTEFEKDVRLLVLR